MQPCSKIALETAAVLWNAGNEAASRFLGVFSVGLCRKKYRQYKDLYKKYLVRRDEKLKNDLLNLEMNLDEANITMAREHAKLEVLSVMVFMCRLLFAQGGHECLGFQNYVHRLKLYISNGSSCLDRLSDCYYYLNFTLCYKPYLSLPYVEYLTFAWITLPYIYLTLTYLITLQHLILPYLELPYHTIPYLAFPYL